MKMTSTLAFCMTRWILLPLNLLWPVPPPVPKYHAQTDTQTLMLNTCAAGESTRISR